MLTLIFFIPNVAEPHRWQPSDVKYANTVFNSGECEASESTTTRIAGSLDFTAISGKGGARNAQSLRVKPGAQHPVCIQTTSRRGGIWKTQ
jgi:hypothetical protein